PDVTATSPRPEVPLLSASLAGAMEASNATETQAPVEWTLSSNPNIPDNYDVSLVDGYNLPARISNNKGCPVAECAKDLGPDCKE
ncbi:hypothetical protein MPER_13688, partial [Moniliophthora perniciosa FA553]